jgi:hypothetical protein
VARLGNREAVAKFPVTELGLQGCFSAGLGAKLSFCLPSNSPFHTCQNGMNQVFLRRQISKLKDKKLKSFF